MKDIILVGIQGSGKGTQAKKLIEKYRYQLIETGGFFRGLRNDSSDLAKRVIAIIDRGDLVPDEIVMEIVENSLAGIDLDRPVLFDGIPRSVVQSDALEQLLDDMGRDFHVIAIDVPEEESFERLLKRAEVEGRADDTHEGIRTRIDAYYASTQPMIEVWEESGRVTHVDGVQSVEGVEISIASIVDAMDR